MRRPISFFAALLLALAFWACAGTPGPGEAGYPFNLSGNYGGEIFVEGQGFTAAMDLRTAAAGEIRGTYQVTSPIGMSGEVTGTLVADTVRFRLGYTNPMDGCGGTLDGTGVVEEGGASFSGSARVNDSCGGYLSGTFSFKK